MTRAKQHRQNLFDKVALHLITQNKQSKRTGDATCRYRGANGTSCAVGCLIPDELYDKKIEFESWYSFIPEGRYNGYGYPTSSDDKDMLLKGIYDHINPQGDSNTDSMIEELQQVHDNSSVEDWPTRLRDVARQFNLKQHMIDLALVLTKEYEL